LSLRRAIWLVVLAVCFSGDTTRAGGGPENTLVVVNVRSWASQTIANHFIHLRQIPAQNVHYIDWDQSVEQVDVERFRKEILGSILENMTRRQLVPQIDCIAYSADFPYAVELKEDLKQVKLPDQFRTLASLNGLTFLWQQVMAKDPRMVSLDANRYCRLPLPAQAGYSTVGFRSWYGWGKEGQLLETGGPHYLLCTLLGATQGRGNSVREVLSYLSRAAQSDGTHPPGTIYFSKTSDVRSQVRTPAFDATVQALRELNVKAEIITQPMPVRRKDVQGALMGTPKFDWASSGSTILPGAICEHFTSVGGSLQENAGQTPLTEFLRYGAAGSSGTVTEPYAIQDKFPLPNMHVHYARGCSLSESFYQSVRGPYQLLIIGDPLCRPWANIPQVEATGVTSGQTLQGSVVITPTAQMAKGEVDRFELFLDGLRCDRCSAGESFTLDTTQFADGWHELRVVGFEKSLIESQGRTILPVTFNNHQQSCELVVDAKEGRVARGAALNATVKSPGARAVLVLNNTRLVGSLESEGGGLSIDTKQLGTGVTTLHAMAIGPAGNLIAQSAPFDLIVSPTAALPAAPAPAGTQPGLKITPSGGKAFAVRDTANNKWLADAGVQPDQGYTLQAMFQVPADDVYQFQIRHQGGLSLDVDGHSLYESTAETERTYQYLPATLAKGWHRLTIVAQGSRDTKLEVRFGGPGLRRIGAPEFVHVP
jgi:uncharacterized protein (TIGR03790 family)